MDGLTNVSHETHARERLYCAAVIVAAGLATRMHGVDKMTADLNNLVKPRLHIMDGVTAMEGNGPRSGSPKAMNVIMAATDPVAMDAVFCHLVHLRPELVPTNVSGMEQGVGTWKELCVVTEDGTITAEEASAIYGDKDFNVQRGTEYRGALRPVRFLAPLLEKKPVVRQERCM